MKILQKIWETNIFGTHTFEKAMRFIITIYPALVVFTLIVLVLNIKIAYSDHIKKEKARLKTMYTEEAIKRNLARRGY